MPRGGRTSIKGVRATKNKFQRASFTYTFKFSVITDNERGLDNQQLKEKYPKHLDGKPLDYIRDKVSKWKASSELIAHMASNVRTGSHLRYRATGTGTVLPALAEEALVEWINGLRSDGVPVSAKILSLHALEVASDYGVTTGFAACPHWRNSFLERHRLSFRARNRSGQAAPDDDNVIGLAFALEVRQWMEEHGVTKVFNADQTGVNSEMLPKTTIAPRGSTTVWVKCGKKEKQRVTAMLLADSDGNKYTLFLVFKVADSKVKTTHEENVALRHGFGRQMWSEIKQLQESTGLQMYGNKAAWWNADLTVAWMKYFFDDRNDQSEPVILLLESFSGHWTDEVKAYAASRNVILKPVPPKLTWQCQPADVAWIKPLKDSLRNKWVDHLRDQLARRKDRTRKFVMRPPDRVDVAESIGEGWLRLSDHTIVSGFVKCGFRDSPTGQRPALGTIEPVDATDVIKALQEIGEIDQSVGAVSDSMDTVDSALEVVV